MPRRDISEIAESLLSTTGRRSDMARAVLIKNLPSVDLKSPNADEAIDRANSFLFVTRSRSVAGTEDVPKTALSSIKEATSEPSVRRARQVESLQSQRMKVALYRNKSPSIRPLVPPSPIQEVEPLEEADSKQNAFGDEIVSGTHSRQSVRERRSAQSAPSLAPSLSSSVDQLLPPVPEVGSSPNRLTEAGTRGTMSGGGELGLEHNYTLQTVRDVVVDKKRISQDETVFLQVLDGENLKTFAEHYPMPGKQGILKEMLSSFHRYRANATEALLKKSISPRTQPINNVISRRVLRGVLSRKVAEADIIAQNSFKSNDFRFRTNKITERREKTLTVVQNANRNGDNGSGLELNNYNNKNNNNDDELYDVPGRDAIVVCKDKIVVENESQSVLEWLQLTVDRAQYLSNSVSKLAALNLPGRTPLAPETLNCRFSRDEFVVEDEDEELSSKFAHGDQFSEEVKWGLKVESKKLEHPSRPTTRSEDVREANREDADRSSQHVQSRSSSRLSTGRQEDQDQSSQNPRKYQMTRISPVVGGVFEHGLGVISKNYMFNTIVPKILMSPRPTRTLKTSESFRNGSLDMTGGAVREAAGPDEGRPETAREARWSEQSARILSSSSARQDAQGVRSSSQRKFRTNKPTNLRDITASPLLSRWPQIDSPSNLSLSLMGSRPSSRSEVL